MIRRALIVMNQFAPYEFSVRDLVKESKCIWTGKVPRSTWKWVLPEAVEKGWIRKVGREYQILDHPIWLQVMLADLKVQALECEAGECCE